MNFVLCGLMWVLFICLKWSMLMPSLEDLRVKILRLLTSGIKQVDVARKLHMSRARVHYIINLDEYRAYHAAYSKGRGDKVVKTTRKPCTCTNCGEVGHNVRRCPWS